MSDTPSGPKLVAPASDTAPAPGPAPVTTPAPAPAAAPGPKPAITVHPPAQKTRLRLRHKFLVLSFICFVVLPIYAISWYLWERAADQYASYVGFSVRTEETSSAVELLGGITELSGGSSSDTDILFAYLTSHELVRRIDETVDLRAIWSRVPVAQDPVFAFDPEGTIEDLLEHWERKVSIVYDNGTGLIDLRIQAFDPEDAKRIAEALLDECTAMINGLTDIAREDSIKFAREELETAVERLKTARAALTSFRNRTQIVDPTIDTQNQMGLLVTLQQQLAEEYIELDILRETSRADDPRMGTLERRVRVIEKRIEAERRKLGIGAGGEEGEVFATLVGEYESLTVDREFAEAAYTGALAAFDSAQAEARKQSRYLAPHVRPTLAEQAEYPERLKILLLSGMFMLFGWMILSLVYYSLRDRS